MSGAVIEQMMRSTAFGKITVVYGHIDENGRLSVNGSLEKCRLRTNGSKIPVCP